jgi:mannose 2-epimerase
VAPQIKFDIVWGWDRFSDSGLKSQAEDNTSYGHNVEFAWLLHLALQVLEEPLDAYLPILSAQYDHALADGIDWEYGGVYVEGSHSGGVYDREKEFWQNAEMLIGLLDACLLFGPERFWPAYENVHRFVFDKMIHHEVGEWWPLLTREGAPIWTHMSHSWKVNYHTVRSMIQSIRRMDQLLAVVS